MPAPKKSKMKVWHYYNVKVVDPETGQLGRYFNVKALSEDHASRLACNAFVGLLPISDEQLERLTYKVEMIPE
jgi:hypothetical protein